MDYAVKFEGVYKEYPYYQHITAGLKSFMFHLPKNIASLKKSRFVVLNGVSFEVKKGETFGIIGRNGSGKSTILSLMAGVIRQDRGRVETHGKISSLLELGAGFHPDLSGMENIILNGILMGHTREEVMGKIDGIKEFSELGDFIYQPLRTYSSGMQVRLGFSVAVHIDPEILLVDEALAVGDMSFQEKCLKKMAEFKEAGATIIMVTHDMVTVDRLCDRAAWIESGDITAIGKPKDVVMKYIKHFEQEAGHSGEDGHAVEAEIQPEAAGVPVPRDVSEVSGKTKAEYLPGSDTVSETLKPSSWWDSPAVARQCEAFITGNPQVTFYEFLRRQYMIGGLDRGLSICNSLKGIEANFMINNICKHFDSIDNEDKIARILSGSWHFKKEYYELFLCVDVLNRVKDLDLFLKDIDSALKDKGVVVAMEYIGPVNLKRPVKELDIADMFCRAINDDSGGVIHSTADSLSRAAGDMSAAVSSKDVIPLIGKFFDVITIQFFGGPLLDLVLNKVIGNLDPDDKKDLAMIKTIMQCEQVMIQEGVLENNYAMILAKKKAC